MTGSSEEASKLLLGLDVLGLETLRLDIRASPRDGSVNGGTAVNLGVEEFRLMKLI